MPHRRRASLLPVGLFVSLPLLFLVVLTGRTLTERLAVAAVAALIVVGVVVASADLLSARRTRALVAATRGVTQGDLSVRIGAPYATGELGRLAQAFDEMADALQRRLSENVPPGSMLQRNLAALHQTDEERRRLLAHLAQAQERERGRIASDIHDDSIQAMTAIGLRLESLRRHIADPGQLGALREVEDTVVQSITRLRHIIFELRPPVLEREGLAPALRVYLEELAANSGLHYELDNRLSEEPPHEVRRLLYRISQEALANIRKHARARTVTALLEEREGGFFVRIRDDGLGFSLKALGPNSPGNVGLIGMRERAQLSGGWCRLGSEPGEGTTVEAWLPATAALERSIEETLA